jgi:hypothetical protein
MKNSLFTLVLAMFCAIGCHQESRHSEVAGECVGLMRTFSLSADSRFNEPNYVVLDSMDYEYGHAKGTLYLAVSSVGSAPCLEAIKREPKTIGSFMEFAHGIFMDEARENHVIYQRVSR